jgi:peptide/nickel transport system ATP-binding protein
MNNERPLQVQVENLSLRYPGDVQALRQVSFGIRAGETLGIVGESGCGKSTLAGALVGDVPGADEMTGHVILHENGDVGDESVDMLNASEAELREIWGRRVATVYQDPQASLNPSYTIGDQIDEAVGRRPDLAPHGIRERTLELLRQVRISSPEASAQRYPHQLSGGQQQRAVIAMALAANPDLLVLDEPTTGLDVTTEARILDLVEDLQREVNASIVFITHNLAVIAQISDRIGVMYAGELVEIGDVDRIFGAPAAPYTAGLLSCIPRIDKKGGGDRRLRTIPGAVPSPSERPHGCAFAPRCPFSEPRCETQHPDLETIEGNGHLARCFYAERVRRQGWPQGQLASQENGAPCNGDEPVLQGHEVVKRFGRVTRKYVFFGPTVRRPVPAVDGISFQLGRGETLGIVGESGCGKSTLLNCVAGLIPPSEGSVQLGQHLLAPVVRQRPRELVQRMQMVFQNPDLSLNPQHTVEVIMSRAVQVLDQRSKRSERATRVLDLLSRVGLGEHYLRRHPAELSGGEKQRVALARALAGHPDVVLADEVTSSLDVSVRAEILNLLNDLQADESISYLFVSHDMGAIRHVSHRVMVLYLGVVMEMGSVEQVFEPPYHPYTEALMSAIPAPDPSIKTKRIRLGGEVPSVRPSGCPFHTRCPRHLGSVCETKAPPWQEAHSGHGIYCHIPLEELTRVTPLVVGDVAESVLCADSTG